MKKVIKKIAALGVGTAMLGATMMGAMAADLKDYPSPLFIKDGAFDGIIVVGAAAAASDVVGSVDIATSLQFASKTTTTVSTTGGTTVTVEGDAYRIDQSSNFVEYDEELDTVVTSDLGSGQLEALKGGEITNDRGTFKYNQYLSLPTNAKVLFVADPDDDESIPANYLKLTQGTGNDAYVYTISFPSALEADVPSSGTAVTDLQNKKMSLLGKEYTITSATRSAKDKLKLELMGGAVQDTMSEGETKTYTINGVDYEVTVTIITSTYVLFKINGEVTDKLAESETFKLKDGTTVGVRTLLSQEFSGGSRIVEFYLGADKITLEDTNITKAASGSQRLKVGSESMDNTLVNITGTDDGSVIKVSSIKVIWTNSDDIYVPVNGKLSEKQKEVGQMFGNWDLEFKGMTEPETETLEVKPQGSDEYKIVFTNEDGQELSIPFLDVDTSTFRYGDENRDFIFYERNATFNIDKYDYFVVNDAKASYLLRYKGYDATSGSELVTFENVATGVESSFDVTTGNIDGLTSGNAAATLRVGTHSFGVWLASNSNDAAVAVDLDASGAISNMTTPTLYTKYGYLVNFVNFSADTLADPEGIRLQIRSRTDLDTGSNYEYINVSFNSPSTDKIDISGIDGDVGGTDTVDMNDVGDTDDKEEISRFGVDIFQTGVTNGPDKLKMTLPKDQLEALVYYTSGVTKTSTSGSSDGVETTVVTPIEVGSAKLDTEVSDISAQNMIVVGGPCANSVAAELMGNPAVCTEGFEEGKAMIKLFENGDKVAMLVAGATALDTRRAARVVANYDQYDLSGMEVEVVGTSTTFTDTVVRAPTKEEASTEEATTEEASTEEATTEE